MLTCPGCGNRLARVGTAKGVVFACAYCRGKAVAFSVTYRADDRTLTGDEADEAVRQLMSALQEQFQAALRAS